LEEKLGNYIQRYILKPCNAIKRTVQIKTIFISNSLKL